MHDTRLFPAVIVGLASVLLQAAPASAQTSPSEPPAMPAWATAALATSRPADRPAELRYLNRRITTLRAEVLGRSPDERAAAAVLFIDRLVDQEPRATVTTESLGAGALLRLAGRPVFAILPDDVDMLAGETVETNVAEAAARLATAFGEAVESRTPSTLLAAVTAALGATAVFVGLLWALRRTYRAGAGRLTRNVEQRLDVLPGAGEIARTLRTADLVRRALGLVSVLLALLLADMWLTFVLRRFPYTRPLGESLRSGVLSALVSAGQVIVDALPGLLTVLAILLAARFVVRLVGLTSDLVGQGRVAIPGVYPETVLPTRRIVIALVWLAALVLSYGFLPGSDSDAFKGVSLFVGLVVSLGSTGIMNQVMSGFTITYSRAIRLGDFVKVGDVEGSVVHLGTLATKIKTPRNEDITIPNAIVVSNATTNYSRNADGEGVFVPASLTIGYDTPWRQVHALLLLAARRTPGLRATPPPVVRQAALQDFSVQYTLLVCLERPHQRGQVLDGLHANIQDAFNEYGVQIMSPNYEADPSGPKVVPRSRWFAAPASPDPDAVGRAGG